MLRPVEPTERSVRLEHLLERLRDPSVTLPEATGLRSRLLSLLLETEGDVSTPAVGPENVMAGRIPSQVEPAGPSPKRSGAG